MTRYINAEQMKGDIRIAMAEQLHKDPFNTLPTHLAELLCQFVDDTPTADVVPRDEVERGVVEYIEKHLRYKRKMVDIPFTSRDMRNYQCGAIDVIEYFEELVNELKEKYTKGGEGE